MFFVRRITVKMALGRKKQAFHKVFIGSDDINTSWEYLQSKRYFFSVVSEPEPPKISTASQQQRIIYRTEWTGT